MSSHGSSMKALEELTVDVMTIVAGLDKSVAGVARALEGFTGTGALGSDEIKLEEGGDKSGSTKEMTASSGIVEAGTLEEVVEGPLGKMLGEPEREPGLGPEGGEGSEARDEV
ncbi:hypothetical protein EIP86_006074 [Pleurotus ostreatoroseus]|nr:hypothetical protein EIP86_006074 [Pleurotus ostreatoroseus]